MLDKGAEFWGRDGVINHVNTEKHGVKTELSLDSKIDSVFWVSNEDIGIVFY